MAQETKVYLDGNQYPLNEVDGLKGVRLTFRDRDDQGQKAKGFSGTLTLSGSAYKYVYNKIINNPNGENEKIDIQVIDGCCQDYEFFNGEIKGREVQWCEGDCRVSVTPIQKKEGLDCIKSVLIAESSKTIKNANPTNFQGADHPRVPYCIELRPSFIQDLFLIIGIILNLVLYALYPVVLIISVIIQIVCAIIDLVPGAPDCPGELQDGILDDYKDFINFLNDILIGCGRVHPSPFVRDYILNACNICGLDFESSILNDANSPYYNTMYFNAAFDEGTHDDSIKMIGMNVPIVTLYEYLEQLKEVHNAEWKLIGGTTIVYERKDFFDTGNIWIDFTKINPKRITKQCYEFANDDLYAFGTFTYFPDGIDYVGDEAKEYYSDIVEWNLPNPNPIQKAERKVQLQFGMSRYRGDEIDVDVLGRAIYNIPIVPYASILKDNEEVLLLNNGTAFSPKLLIWDGQKLSHAKTKRYLSQGLGGKNGFNYPYVFEQIDGETPAQYIGGKLQMTEQKNLYHNFFEIDNPRLMAFARRNFKLDFNYICDELRTLNTDDKIIISFNGIPKQASVDQVDVDPEKRQMSITGKV